MQNKSDSYCNVIIKINKSIYFMISQYSLSNMSLWKQETLPVSLLTKIAFCWSTSTNKKVMILLPLWATRDRLENICIETQHSIFLLTIIYNLWSKFTSPINRFVFNKNWQQMKSSNKTIVIYNTWSNK